MQNGVFLAITMPVADEHSVICAQNAASPMLCVAPEDRGVGYFYFIFRCSSLQGYNPHPMVTANLHANFAWVQFGSRLSHGEASLYAWSGAGQGRPYPGELVLGGLAGAL